MPQHLESNIQVPVPPNIDVDEVHPEFYDLTKENAYQTENPNYCDLSEENLNDPGEPLDDYVHFSTETQTGISHTPTARIPMHLEPIPIEHSQFVNFGDVNLFRKSVRADGGCFYRYLFKTLKECFH